MKPHMSTSLDPKPRKFYLPTAGAAGAAGAAPAGAAGATGAARSSRCGSGVGIDSGGSVAMGE